MKRDQKLRIYHTETCVFCGAEIPEGSQICPECKRKIKYTQPYRIFEEKNTKKQD